MTGNAGQFEASVSGKGKGAHGWFEGLRHAAWIVPGCAVLVVILFIVVGRADLSHTGRRLLNALVYSALIGLPSAVLLSWVSHRYAKRFGRWILLPQVAILLATATVGSLVASVVLAETRMVPHPMAEWRESYPFCLMITMLIGLSITTYETLRYKLQAATVELRTRQIEQERAYKLLAEARMSSLESRIHPHFLFNTLNSIAALIPRDPERAEATVGKLASLLRFSLAEHNGGLVPLAQELKIVRDYLEIEVTRFGPRLRYEIDIPDALLQTRVPPLALQCLVENSVKHVAAQRPEGATIHVTGSARAEMVGLEVSDDGPGFALDAITPEHGLGNLVSRMELLFGERGKLDVARREGKTVVSLQFPVGA